MLRNQLAQEREQLDVRKELFIRRKYPISDHGDVRRRAHKTKHSTYLSSSSII